jgi:hypothetical protein
MDGYQKDIYYSNSTWGWDVIQHETLWNGEWSIGFDAIVLL